MSGSVNGPSILKLSKSDDETNNSNVNDLLARVKNFLPQIEQANDELQQTIAKHGGNNDHVNIENLDEKSENVIQMELGLGVYELKPSLASEVEQKTAQLLGLDDTNTNNSSKKKKNYIEEV